MLGFTGISINIPTDLAPKIIIAIIFVVLSILLSAIESAVRERRLVDKREMMGALSFVTERVERRFGSKQQLPKPVFISELSSLQSRLLDHARRAISEESGVDINSVWANWCVEEVDNDNKVFCVQCFHGDAHKRTPGSKHEIADYLPGASKAFSTSKVTIVDDTHDPELKEFFDQDTEYRCILSVPVRIAAGGDQWVIGVTNFDSKIPDSFSMDMERVVADFVYLIGLCEVLKKWQ